MTFTRTAAAIAAVLVTLAAAVDAAEPELKVVPEEVVTRTLPKGTPIKIELHLKAGDAELTSVSVSTFSNDGISAEFDPGTPATIAKIPARAEHAWQLLLTREGGSVLTESILHVRVTFDALPVTPLPGSAQRIPDPGPAQKGTPPVKSAPVKQVEQKESAAPAPNADQKGSGSASPAPDPAANLAPDAVAPSAMLTRRLLYKSAKIKPQAAITGIELAKAEIKGAPETLAHERPGPLFIIVTNQYSRALTVKDVKLLGPNFIELVGLDNKPLPKTQSPLLTIPPGQASNLNYNIRAKSEVVPGKYSLIANVDVETDDKIAATVRTTPEAITVAVLGESDVLKFLGIPSLLFLPGVLMLTAWQFLWAWGRKEAERTEYPLQWNTRDFWIIAVTLSLITALIYPYLTYLIVGSSRNFVAAYGLLDFSLILGISLIGTIATFTAWRGAVWLYAQHKAREVAKVTPNAQDDPLSLLDKLARLKHDIQLPQAHFTGGNKSERLLVLEPWTSETEYWLAPPFELKDVKPRNYLGLTEADKLATGQILDSTSAAAKIRQGIEQGWWSTPGWRRVGDIRKPVKVQKTGWTELAGSGRLIHGD